MQDTNAETIKLRRWKHMMTVKVTVTVPSSDSEDEDEKEVEENNKRKGKTRKINSNQCLRRQKRLKRSI